MFQICGLNIVEGSGERVEKLTSKGSASPLYVGVSGTGGVGKNSFSSNSLWDAMCATPSLIQFDICEVQICGEYFDWWRYTKKLENI